MSNKKISELTELTSVSSDDLMAIVDDPSGSPETKKITVANLIAGTFDTRYLKLDGSNANTNIDIGIYDLTANAFIGDGSGLTGIDASQIANLDGSHFHDGDTLQHDGVNSDGGNFDFKTTGDLKLYPSNSASVHPFSYFNFNVQSGYTYLTLKSPDQTLHIEGLNVDVVGFSLDGDATHYTKLQTYPNLEYTELYCSHPLHLITSGDSNDYLEFYTFNGKPVIKRIGGSNICLESDNSVAILTQFHSDVDHCMYVGYYKAAQFGSIDCRDRIDLISGNAADYLRFQTISNVPEITTVGVCDLKLTASSGLIDFDDENLQTTGNISCAELTASTKVIATEMECTGNMIFDSSTGIYVSYSPAGTGLFLLLVQDGAAGVIFTASGPVDFGVVNLITGGNIIIDRDNYKLQLGTGNDASIYYDGTDLICNPKDVGTGGFKVSGKLTAEGYHVNVVDKTGAYTATATDDMIICDGTFTIALPASASSTGKKYYIKNKGTGIITVDGNASEEIDGDTTQDIETDEGMILVSDGVGWYID